MELFTDYSYLWPSRPEKAFMPLALGTYETLGHHLQIKMNGTCSVVYRTPDRQIIAMNRHNEPHKQWAPTQDVMRQFIDLPGNGWYVFFTELMHNKLSTIKEVNYIRDMVVDNGEYLVGSKFSERQERLAKLFLKGSEPLTLSHHVIDRHTWLARTYEPGIGYRKLYNQLVNPEHEGVVLIDPKIELAMCTRATSNVSWLAKCRRPTKNYTQ